VKVNEVNGSLHFESTPFCDCDGPVCIHGWDFRMVSVVLVQSEKRVGASGFDIDAFMAGGLSPIAEEDFSDAYTTLDPGPIDLSEVARVETWQAKADEAGGMVDPNEIKAKSLEFIKRSDAKNGTNFAKDLERAKGQHQQIQLPPPPPPLPRARVTRARQGGQTAPKPVAPQVTSRTEEKVLTGIFEMLGKLRADSREMLEKVDRVEAASDLVVGHQTAQQAMTPPANPVQRIIEIDRGSMLSVEPQDSSSVLERYSKGYMSPGTVFTVQAARTTADAADNRTMLTSGNYLVDGYHRSADVAKREASSVKKLQPINGLPRPFQNLRLNFLANFHTGLGRATKSFEGSTSEVVSRVLKSNSLVPVDNLLRQVLSVTIDRRHSEFVSNPFSLPYIEIGMLVTEEALVKMLDLVQTEYKQLWFQELKSIVVPKFHSDYKHLSTDPVILSSSRSSTRSRGREESTRLQLTRPRSFLGL